MMNERTNTAPATPAPPPSRETATTQGSSLRVEVVTFQTGWVKKLYRVLDGDKFLVQYGRKADAQAHVKGLPVVAPVGFLGSGRGFNVWRGARAVWFRTMSEAVNFLAEVK